MNLSRVLLAVLVRSVVVVGVIAVYVAVIARSESTDALGAGLVAFFILVAMACVWALVDGVRHGFVHSLLTWVGTSAVAGAGIPVALALTISDATVATEIRDGFVFFLFVLLVPAVLGLGVGAIVNRIRGGGTVEAPEVARTGGTGDQLV